MAVRLFSRQSYCQLPDLAKSVSIEKKCIVREICSHIFLKYALDLAGEGASRDFGLFAMFLFLKEFRPPIISSLGFAPLRNRPDVCWDAYGVVAFRSRLDSLPVLFLPNLNQNSGQPISSFPQQSFISLACQPIQEVQKHLTALRGDCLFPFRASFINFW